MCKMIPHVSGVVNRRRTLCQICAVQLWMGRKLASVLLPRCCRERLRASYEGGHARAAEGGFLCDLQGLLLLQEAGTRPRGLRPHQWDSRAWGGYRRNSDEPSHHHHESHPTLPAAALREPQFQPTGATAPLWLRGTTFKSSYCCLDFWLTFVSAFESRTFCGTRTTRPTTIWCVRLFSSWTVSVEAPQEVSGCWAFI